MVEQAGGALLFALVAIFLAVLTALALYEAWCLLTKQPPITWFVRLGVADHPRFTFVIALVVGLLGGHFFWR